ncbi:MAG: radical SAM protein [Candidatus Odinarchaeia archaeon]
MDPKSKLKLAASVIPLHDKALIVSQTLEVYEIDSKIGSALNLFDGSKSLEEVLTEARNNFGIDSADFMQLITDLKKEGLLESLNWRTRSQNWENKLIRKAWVFLSRTCPFHCDHCHITSNAHSNRYMRENTIKEIAEKIYTISVNNPAIWVMDGNVYLHMDRLKNFIKLLERNGDPYVIINAIPPKEKHAHELLKYSSVKRFLIDINGELSQNELNVIKDILKEGDSLEVELSLTLTDEINSKLDYVRKKLPDFKVYVKLPSNPSYRLDSQYVTEFFNQLVNDKTVRLWDDYLFRTHFKLTRYTSVTLTGVSLKFHRENCGVGENIIAIDYTGEAYPCYLYLYLNKNNLGKLASNVFEKFPQGPPADFASLKDSRCTSCCLLQYCGCPIPYPFSSLEEKCRNMLSLVKKYVAKKS